MGSTALVVIIVVVALGFDFTNGFHDSANAIATSISTKALTPRVALAMAAIFNIVGALISTKVAKTVGSGIINQPGKEHVTHGLVVVLAALVGAIVWNLGTWYFGLPSSSSHALIGGLVGAALASSETVHWHGVVEKVVIPMVISPLIGFGLSYLFMIAVLWAFRRANAVRANRGFRWAQIASAATMSFGHGTQDAQKTMGVIALTLVVSGHLGSSADIPLWVVLVGGRRHRRRHLFRRLAHHAHARPADLLAHPAQRLRGADGGQRGPSRDGALRPAGVDDARHHVVGDGRGGHAAGVGGALGRRGQHPVRLGPHDSGGGRGGRAGVGDLQPLPGLNRTASPGRSCATRPRSTTTAITG